MKDRSLKIGYGVRSKRSARWNESETVHPKLSLMGRWLERAGFEIGDRVKVSVEFGRLVVEKEGGQGND